MSLEQTYFFKLIIFGDNNVVIKELPDIDC